MQLLKTKHFVKELIKKILKEWFAIPLIWIKLILETNLSTVYRFFRISNYIEHEFLHTMVTERCIPFYVHICLPQIQGKHNFGLKAWG